MIRDTRRPSSICSSTACCSFCPLASSMPSSFSACGTVRGKPSRMNLDEGNEVSRDGSGGSENTVPVLAFLIGVEFVLNHVNHYIVAHETALIHNLLGFSSELSLLRYL